MFLCSIISQPARQEDFEPPLSRRNQQRRRKGMFDLTALTILMILNLIILAQVASAALALGERQTTPRGGAMMFCLSVSLMGLGLLMLLPSPGMGIATLSVAALVNLLAALSPGMRRLSELHPTQIERSMGRLVRFSWMDTSPVLASAPSTPSATGSGIMRSARPTVQAAVRTVTDLLPRAASAASARLVQSPARMLHLLPGASSAPDTNAAQTPDDLPPLAPRQHYTVPRRPNRLPTSSLAFLLSVDPAKMPDIFADARASMARRPALGRRVRLVAIHPRCRAFNPHNERILPSSFATPDPAWQTTYGRFAALIRSA
jgi:hypothetical protein